MRKLLLVAGAALLAGAAPSAQDRPVVSEFAVDTMVRCTRMSYGDEPRRTGKPPPRTRCARLSYGPKEGDGITLPNTPPAVVLSTAPSSRPGAIIIRAAAKDAEDRNLNYNYSGSTGTVKGEGIQVLWLPGVSARPGRHRITVEVDDGCGCLGIASADAVFSR